MNKAETLISITNLEYKTFNSKENIIDGISLQIKSNSIHILTGRNGSGKTTLINLIFNGYEPTKGSISFHDNIEKEIGYVSGVVEFPLIATVKNYIKSFSNLYGIDKNELNNRIDRYLKQFKLTKHANKRISKLSSGQKRKVQLVVALISDPKLIVMDEPFTNLDIQTRNELVDLIKALSKKGISFLIITHSFDFFKDIANELTILQDGKIKVHSEAKGKLKGIIDKYSNEVQND